MSVMNISKVVAFNFCRQVRKKLLPFSMERGDPDERTLRNEEVGPVAPCMKEVDGEEEDKEVVEVVEVVEETEGTEDRATLRSIAANKSMCCCC